MGDNLHPERSQSPRQARFLRVVGWRSEGSLFLDLLISSAMILLLGFATTIHAQTAPQQLSDSTFTDRTASTLLLQLSESLQGHSQKKLLALFDLQKMKDGQLFKQQINSFFSQTESIAVHLNLAETNAEGENPTFAVDAEMELQPLNGGQATRRNERVTFTIARAGKDWKLIDVQPRSFFSLP